MWLGNSATSLQLPEQPLAFQTTASHDTAAAVETLAAANPLPEPSVVLLAMYACLADELKCYCPGSLTEDWAARLSGC